MELWDVYDINRKLTGKTMTRGDVFDKDNYRLVVHVCIFNMRGEMLIQQRQSFKHGWPNAWDITLGGCAIKGETSQAAAEREVFEELGLRLDLQNLRPHMTINFINGFDDIYLLEKEIDIKQLTLQYEEVQDAKWATKDKICSMIENRTFIPYYPNLIKMLFDMRKQYGIHQANQLRNFGRLEG